MDLLEIANQYRSSNNDLMTSIQEMEVLANNGNYMDEDGYDGYSDLALKLMNGWDHEEGGGGGEHRYDSTSSQEELHLCENVEQILEMEVEIEVIPPSTTTTTQPLDRTKLLKYHIENLLLERESKITKDREIELKKREQKHNQNVEQLGQLVDQSFMNRMDLTYVMKDIKLNKLRLLPPDVVTRMMKQFRAHAIIEDLSNTGKSIYHASHDIYSILIVTGSGSGDGGDDHDDTNDYHIIHQTALLV